MEVKPGYRSPEMAVLPEGWEVVLLDRIANRGSGHTPDKKRREYWNGNVKWISLADSSALDRVYIDDTFAKVTTAGIANSSAVIHPAGTVVLSRDAGVGKSAIMRTEMAVSQHFMAWTCGPRLNNHFLYYWLQLNKSEFERIANGSTIKTIGLPYFQDLEIPCPPPSEQHAMAAALLDVDALLGGLDRVIAKKRDLKQAAMQQLLTGQTRLPNFDGEWKPVEFGDVASIRNFKVIASSTPAGTQCVELDCLSQGSGQLLRSIDATGSSSKYSFKTGDVLFGRLRAYLRKYWLASFNGLCSTEIWPLIPRDERLSPAFLHLLVQTSAFVEAAGGSYGTHMPRSDWSVLRRFTVLLPPFRNKPPLPPFSQTWTPNSLHSKPAATKPAPSSKP